MSKDMKIEKTTFKNVPVVETNGAPGTIVSAI